MIFFFFKSCFQTIINIENTIISKKFFAIFFKIAQCVGRAPIYGIHQSTQFFMEISKALLYCYSNRLLKQVFKVHTTFNCTDKLIFVPRIEVFLKSLSPVNQGLFCESGYNCSCTNQITTLQLFFSFLIYFLVFTLVFFSFLHYLEKAFLEKAVVPTISIL